MTVNFGSIKNITSSYPRMQDGAGKIYNAVKVTMHFDNKGTKDLAKMQEFFPELTEHDVVSIQSTRPSHSYINGATIEINGTSFVNGFLNKDFFKPFTSPLKKILKMEDKNLFPNEKFVKSGQLKQDVFGSVADQVIVPEEDLVEHFAQPEAVKNAAKDILDDIYINNELSLAEYFKKASESKWLVPPKRHNELPN